MTSVQSSLSFASYLSLTRAVLDGESKMSHPSLQHVDRKMHQGTRILGTTSCSYSRSLQ